MLHTYQGKFASDKIEVMEKTDDLFQYFDAEALETKFGGSNTWEYKFPPAKEFNFTDKALNEDGNGIMAAETGEDEYLTRVDTIALKGPKSQNSGNNTSSNGQTQVASSSNDNVNDTSNKETTKLLPNNTDNKRNYNSSTPESAYDSDNEDYTPRNVRRCLCF